MKDDKRIYDLLFFASAQLVENQHSGSSLNLLFVVINKITRAEAR